MSFFSKILGRNSVYVLGIVITGFAIDRTNEIGSEFIWKTANKGVSVINSIKLSIKFPFGKVLNFEK